MEGSPLGYAGHQLMQIEQWSWELRVGAFAYSLKMNQNSVVVMSETVSGTELLGMGRISSGSIAEVYSSP